MRPGSLRESRPVSLHFQRPLHKAMKRFVSALLAVYDGAADAYAKGLFRYLEVLDAQRTLFELHGQHLQALAAYHAAEADLERLTGTPLSARDAVDGGR